MSYILLYSPMAKADLDRVWDEVFDASQDLSTTDRYISNLIDSIKAKKAYSKTGKQLCYMGEFTGIYYVTFKEYMAFYRIRENVKEVSRILFARSDYMKTLFGRSEYTMDDTD